MVYAHEERRLQAAFRRFADTQARLDELTLDVCELVPGVPISPEPGDAARRLARRGASAARDQALRDLKGLVRQKERP